MKKLIFIALSLSAINAFSFECSQKEAQIIGKITSTRVERIDQGIRDCFHKLEFRYFNPSMLCPLDTVDALNLELVDFDCQLDSSSEISGVLIEKDGQLFLD